MGGKGGDLTADAIQEILATAKEKAPRAFKIICDLMEDASRDTVRLSAAVKVLQLAGVELAVEQAADPEKQPKPANPYSHRPTAELLKGASVSATLPQ